MRCLPSTPWFVIDWRVSRPATAAGGGAAAGFEFDVTSAACTECQRVRQRLGEEPLAELFGLPGPARSRPAVNVRQPLRVLAVDGVVWSAPTPLRIESNWQLQQPAWPSSPAADPRHLPDGHTATKCFDAARRHGLRRIDRQRSCAARITRNPV